MPTRFSIRTHKEELKRLLERAPAGRAFIPSPRSVLSFKRSRQSMLAVGFPFNPSRKHSGKLKVIYRQVDFHSLFNYSKEDYILLQELKEYIDETKESNQ